MAVSLTLSETLHGAAIADALAGGGSGLDLGSCTNNSYSPLINKTLNTGAQNLYISHNATVDPITSLKVHIGQFGALTGFTYGGARTAAGDYADLKTWGQASGSSKNNGDGLSYGLWMDMDWNVSDANKFDIATRPTLVKIFGDAGTDGIDLASAFTIAADAMVYDSSGETSATSPVAGSVGKSGDSVLGDSAHIQLRIYLADAHIEGGIYQWETVFSFSYTA